MADNETAAMDQLNHTRIEAQLDKSTYVPGRVK